MKQKTVLQELISEFEEIKNNKCKTPQEVLFFDAVLAIIESKYLEKEKQQIIDSYYAGTVQPEFDNAAPIVNYKTPEEYYKEISGL